MFEAIDVLKGVSTALLYLLRYYSSYFVLSLRSQRVPQAHYTIRCLIC
jgi:hypothetical protein